MSSKYLHFCKNLFKFRQIPKAKFCTSACEKEDDVDVASVDYLSSSDDYKIGRKHVVKKLQQFFDVEQSEATKAALRCTNLSKVMIKTITDNYNLLRKRKVCNKNIWNYLEVLADPFLNEKIKLLKPMRLPICQTFPVLLLRIDDVKRLSKGHSTDKQLVHSGRMVYISTLLNLPIYNAAELLLRKRFLRCINLEILKERVDFLLDCGITLDEIVRDSSILAYKKSFVKERFDYASQHHLKILKTWMARASDDVFKKYVKKKSDTLENLGDISIVEHLADKLECSAEVVELILEKNPALYKKLLLYTTEIIDLLYSKDFTATQIVRNPRILLCNTHTIAKRLKQLEMLGAKVDELDVLLKTNKKFVDYLLFDVKAKMKIEENAQD